MHYFTIIDNYFTMIFIYLFCTFVMNWISHTPQEAKLTFLFKWQEEEFHWSLESLIVFYFTVSI